MAIAALRRRNQTHLLTTLSLVNAIILSGDRVAAAVAGSGSSPSADGLGKIIDELKGLLLPEMVEDLEKKTESIKKKLKTEVNRGPLYIRAPKRREKNRVVRRRKQ